MNDLFETVIACLIAASVVIIIVVLPLAGACWVIKEFIIQFSSLYLYFVG